MLMWAPTAGACLEWFKRNFCADLTFDQINEMANSVSAGSEGLICLPHLCGMVMPNNKPDAKGVFFGATLKHERGHFARSIMESVAYMIKEFVDFMGVNVSEIRSMGGGAKSALWCNVKSQVLDKTIVTLKENETACLGSAIFAGVGLKVFDDIDCACEKLVIKNKVYKSENTDYQALYKDYKTKEKKLLEIF